MRCFNALRRSEINQPDPRIEALKAWIRDIELDADDDPARASDDASFRRYFRLHAGGKSFIAMDAPPDRENSQPFVQVAGFLKLMQLNAPRVIDADLEQGFLLLSDLGTDQYLDHLNADRESAGRLYGDAIDALLKMQSAGTTYQSQLPPYDEKLLRFELSLFHDWLCGTHLELELSDDDEAAWATLCDLLVDNALSQPKVFVHRDYHSRNLMVMNENNPGVLDFQDAVEGPLTYDLVSLLKDCYIRWPADRVRDWALDFNRRLDAPVDEDQFLRWFELMGVQRHIKAAGIFCRLNHRDGKARYLDDVPQTVSYITELAPRYPELEFVATLIDERVLPNWGAGQ